MEIETPEIVEENEVTEGFATAGLADRDEAYEQWVDDCERMRDAIESAEREFASERIG